MLDYNYFLSLPLATPAAVRSFEAFRRAALTADPAAAAAAGLEESVFMKPQVGRAHRGLGTAGGQGALGAGDCRWAGRTGGWGLQGGPRWRLGLRTGGWAAGFGSGEEIRSDWDGG